MKRIALAVLALTASQASAQQTRLDVFQTEAAQSFAVLTPGSGPVSVSPEPVATQESLIDLEADFEVLRPSSVGGIGYSGIPYVPSWMRNGRSPFMPRMGQDQNPPVDPACMTTGYFPRFGISGEAQARRLLYFDDIMLAACEARIPFRLFDALVAQESRYRPYARSSAGAMGLTQLMPGTARYVGVRDPWNVQENLRGGARYLREQLDRFGSWELALAAYNAGPGNVQKFGGLPPFSETRTYVRTIMATLDGRAIFQSTPVSMLAANPFRRVQLAMFSPASQIPEN